MRIADGGNPRGTIHRIQSLNAESWGAGFRSIAGSLAILLLATGTPTAAFAAPPERSLRAAPTLDDFTIDGQFKESIWGGAQPARYELQTGDFAELRVAFNENYLVFAIWVNDTDVRNGRWNPDAKWETWVDDCVEIYVDALANGGTAPQSDDFEIHFDTSPRMDARGMPDNGWTEQGNGSDWKGVHNPDWKVFMSNLRRACRFLGGRPNDSTDRDLGFVWEISVPWSVLPVAPSRTEEKKMGLLQIVGDRDSDAGKCETWKSWPSPSDRMKPSSWGKLILPPLDSATKRAGGAPAIAGAAAGLPSPAPATGTAGTTSAPAAVAAPPVSPPAQLTWTPAQSSSPNGGIPANGAPTVLYFRTPEAKGCQAVERDVLPVPSLQAALQRYNRVVVDLSTPANKTLAERFSIFQTPSLMVLGSDGQVVLRFDGFVDRADLESDLNQASGRLMGGAGQN